MILTHGANSLARGDFVEIGGRRYPVVKIGNQLWMAENLDYKFDVNGSQIPIGQSDTPTTPAAWYYNNNETDYGIDGTYKCGLLYNWYAVEYLAQNQSTLLPDGWYVPSSDVDWSVLVTYIGSSPGTKLKALNNSVTSSWPSDWNGSDDYGFKGLPSGSYNGTFNGVATTAEFWTTTLVDNYPMRRLLGQGNTCPQYDQQKFRGCSLRLVKDA